MTFKEKIKGILDSSYNLTPAEVNLEQRLWERHYSTEDENIIICSEERIRELKEYNREYHREYYRRKLAKGKWTADRAYTTRTEGSVSRSQDKSQNNKRQADYRNKLCNYLNETVKFGTLIHRFYKDFGSWSLATAEAKKYIIKQKGEENK